jgi:hypothetical protein
MFTTSILKVEEKKNQLFGKKNSYTFKYLKYMPKIKGLIQIFASALEKYNYINFAFDTNANKSLKKNVLNKLILFQKFIYMLYSFIWKTPIFFITKLFKNLLYHAFTHGM